jgi:hypothetical protein
VPASRLAAHFVVDENTGDEEEGPLTPSIGQAILHLEDQFNVPPNSDPAWETDDECASCQRSLPNPLTEWMEQPLQGEVELVLGLDDLHKQPPKPVDELLRLARRDAQEAVAAKKHKLPAKADTVFDAADHRLMANEIARLEQLRARRERIVDLAPPCSSPGIVVVVSDQLGDASPDVEVADVWKADVTTHLPSRWLHALLKHQGVLDCLEDVLINGRSWRNGE